MRKSAPLFCALLLSLSARRAWIEILCMVVPPCWAAVALRKESVDRNHRSACPLKVDTVALRKESVDRNYGTGCGHRPAMLSLSARRAWIEILGAGCQSWYCGWSLSARRAWIEISVAIRAYPFFAVALRKESVDRNHQALPASLLELPSLSARRAWIEISICALIASVDSVALRKESVDRNSRPPDMAVYCRRRSPQGERG